MNSFSRLFGFLVLLIAGVCGAAWFTQGWLRGQAERLRAELVVEKRAQLATALALTSLPGGTGANGGDSMLALTAEHRAMLEQMLGVTITGPEHQDRIPSGNSQLLEFNYGLTPPGTALESHLHVQFPMPASARLVLVHQRLVLIAILVGPLVVGLLSASFFLGSGRGTRVPWPATARAEMGSLEHLAKTSVAQGEALTRERDVRRRAEEDVELKQRLLTQSLEEKIRLGRDLHDGIIQSLYAVGLTLESARQLTASNPAEADRRLGSCLESLNRTIRDVRTYITGLSPDNLRRTGFAQVLDSLIAELSAGRSVEFELRIDDDAVALLTSEQSGNALQIAREAISNSLRHGSATRITVRLHRTDREIGLLIQDNGAGFDTSRRAEGHGLGNMDARAKLLGAGLRVESRPAHGTRVIVTLPLHQPA